jgi:hypothetical protein
VILWYGFTLGRFFILYLSGFGNLLFILGFSPRGKSRNNYQGTRSPSRAVRCLAYLSLKLVFLFPYGFLTARLYLYLYLLSLFFSFYYFILYVHPVMPVSFYIFILLYQSIYPSKGL